MCHLLDYRGELKKPRIREDLRQGSELVKKMMPEDLQQSKGMGATISKNCQFIVFIRNASVDVELMLQFPSVRFMLVLVTSVFVADAVSCVDK
jgi:hypothetical protein